MIEALPIKALTEVPEFSTKDSLGNSFSKKSLLGKKYLLFFYPRDNTPGCTAEACGFRDQQSFFDKKIFLFLEFQAILQNRTKNSGKNLISHFLYSLTSIIKLQKHLAYGGKKHLWDEHSKASTEPLSLLMMKLAW